MRRIPQEFFEFLRLHRPKVKKNSAGILRSGVLIRLHGLPNELGQEVEDLLFEELRVLTEPQEIEDLRSSHLSGLMAFDKTKDALAFFFSLGLITLKKTKAGRNTIPAPMSGSGRAPKRKL